MVDCFDHYQVRPSFYSTQAPLRAEDRHIFCQLLRDEVPYRRFWRYIVFLNSLCAWIEHYTGDPICARLHDLLGVTTASDWRTLSNGWHRTNAELRQSLASTLKSTPASDASTQFGLFDAPIVVSEYTFTSLNNWMNLKAEAERMDNCVEAYLGRCVSRNQHVRCTRARAFEIYREALERRKTMGDSLCKRAIKAASKFRGYQDDPLAGPAKTKPGAANELNTIFFGAIFIGARRPLKVVPALGDRMERLPW